MMGQDYGEGFGFGLRLWVIDSGFGFGRVAIVSAFVALSQLIFGQRLTLA